MSPVKTPKQVGRTACERREPCRGGGEELGEKDQRQKKGHLLCNLTLKKTAQTRETVSEIKNEKEKKKGNISYSNRWCLL